MRKFLLSLLILGLICVYPVYATVTEGGNIVKMTAAADATTSSFKISTIVWTSVAGSEITAADGFILTDEAGVEIISSEATAIEGQLVVSFAKPLVVKGLTASTLDTGALFIYGQRR